MCILWDRNLPKFLEKQLLVLLFILKLFYPFSLYSLQAHLIFLQFLQFYEKLCLSSDDDHDKKMQAL